MEKNKTATSHWLTPFMKLREQIQSLVAPHVGLYHGVFLTGPADPNDLSYLADDLVGSRFAPHVQTISVQVSDDARAHHCFFTRNKEGFAKLQTTLLDLDRWVKEVPLDVLPKLKEPSVEQHEYGQLATWMCLLYYLAWKFGDEILWAELEYSDSVVDLMWKPWSRCSASAVSDPRPLMTLTPEDKALGRWKPGVEVDGRKCPSVVSAYLETDVLLASMQAILLLKYVGLDPGAPTSQGMPPPRRSRRPWPRGSTSGDRIFWALIRHHDRSPNTRNNSPLDEEEIAKGASVSRSTVSRRFPKIVPGGVEKYRELCEKGEIQKHLAKCQESPNWQLIRGIAPRRPEGSPTG